MSAFLDAMTGDPFYTDSVGPQNDGTNLIASSSVMNNPSDTGGGIPANYSQSVLDVFKFGVQTWAGLQSQKNAIAAKTAVPAGYVAPAVSGGINLSSNFLLLLAAGVAVLMLAKD